ncbi:MAG: AraC family ligand binding domain-containing protein [Planctomycetes bacterium]|nr:AraC family ligand binding domain-containing protein [Planctomycetota bacterium]
MAKRPVRRLAIPAGDGASGIVTARALAMPEVRFVGLTQVGPQWSDRPHTHDEYEIHFVRRGRGTLRAGGRSYPVYAGDIYLFRPAEVHGGETSAEDPAQVLYLGFTLPAMMRAQLFPRLDDEPVFLHTRPRVAGGSTAEAGELRSALQTLAEDLVAACPTASGHHRLDPVPMSVIADCLRVLAALVRPSARPEVASGTRGERALTDALLRRLELQGARPQSLAQHARAMHVTAAHLGAALRAATGRTFPQVRADRCAQVAQALLADPAIPVREIALRVGLSGPRALAKLLRRTTGRSPEDFRPR